MLQFIIGRACTGKTEKVLELIGNSFFKNEQKTVLLVPEQFSFEAERILLERFGERAATQISVLSFTRLFDEVARQCGTLAGIRMSESDAVILMGRALLQEKNELKCFTRLAENEGFAQICAKTVAELKTAAISANQLRDAANNISGRLKGKLLDLARIMDAFNMQVAGKFIDPRDTLDRLYDMLLKTKYFENKNVFIDGFKDFTGQQQKIVNRIIESAGSVVMTLCCENSYEEDEVFATAVNTRKALEKYAKSVGVKILEPVVLEKSYYESPELEALEKLLFSAGETAQCDAQNITVCEAATPEDEALFAMYTIKNLVRQKGMRYRDFAIIVRDADLYERLIVKAAAKYDVPCFTDSRESAAELPLFLFAQAALDTTVSFTAENILKLLKSGLTGISAEDVSRLENYAFIWDLKGKDWTKAWTMDPEGLQQSNERTRQKSQDELLELNRLREKAINPLLSLKRSMGDGNTEQIATALWSLLGDFGAPKMLETLANEYEQDGKFKEADLIRRSYDVFCDVLDHTVRCLDKMCTKKEFVNAFRLASVGTDMGTVPQTLDSVLFGSADRIRTNRPVAVIALGLNSAEWPKTCPQGSLLSIKDRQLLLENGMRITGLSEQFAADENYLCYSCICSPSRYLYAVYHKASGKDLTQSSYIINLITDKFPKCNKTCWPQKNDSIEYIETEKNAFSVLAESLNDDSELSLALIKSLMGREGFADRLKALKRAGEPFEAQLCKQTVDKIIKGKTSMSPSATESFTNCRFSYFCKYILKAKVLQKANLNVLQRGTMVHYVLEKLVQQQGKSLKTATDELISKETLRLCNEYISQINGLCDVMDARMKYLFELIGLQIKEVALRLRDEFAQSGFEPSKCELEIDVKGDIQPLEFSSNGVTLVARGKVDRVDVCGAYLRIVDYKTGSKKFRLSDVLVGQNMQMLLYLYTLIKSEKYKNMRPAGILYMTAQRSKNDDNSLTMNGLLAQDIELVNKMDKNNSGKFVPVLEYTKDGALNKRTSAKTYIAEQDFGLVFAQIDKVMTNIANKLSQGDIAVSPTDCAGDDACKYCDFKAVCGIENKVHSTNPSVSTDEVIEVLREELCK